MIMSVNHGDNSESDGDHACDSSEDSVLGHQSDNGDSMLVQGYLIIHPNFSVMVTMVIIVRVMVTTYDSSEDFILS